MDIILGVRHEKWDKLSHTIHAELKSSAAHSRILRDEQAHLVVAAPPVVGRDLENIPVGSSRRTSSPAWQIEDP
jgi:hypothetical protein